MNSVKTYYPDHDVMNDSGEWDSHTKEIVRKRLGPFPPHKFLTDKEAKYLAIIAEHISYDNRKEIMEWVVHYLDGKLNTTTGEGQRKVGVPREAVLIREGLKAIDHVARLSHGQDFENLPATVQFEILAGLQKGQTAQIPEWGLIPPKELFNKLASEITSAYYSHPAIWSEIGYGGPVYPKSYVRIEFGLTDPWEAKRNGK